MNLFLKVFPMVLEISTEIMWIKRIVAEVLQKCFDLIYYSK